MSNAKVTHPYPFIQAFNSLKGSMPYWITRQIEKAKADGAPKDAVCPAGPNDNHLNHIVNGWRTLRTYQDAQKRGMSDMTEINASRILFKAAPLLKGNKTSTGVEAYV